MRKEHVVAKDLRSYLEGLRSRAGDLVEIERPIRPHDFEATALLKQLEDSRQYPAVLFRQPTDVHEQPSLFALLTNVYATRERCALMLDVDPATPYREVSLAYARAARGSIEPAVIAPQAAPVRECVWQGADADVGRLPIVRHFAMDMGPTLTMSHVMRSVEGFYDVSFAKTFYKWDPQRMVVSIHTRDLSRMVKEYEERDEPAPIINVLGHHPAFHLGVVARNPWGTNDYATLGSFLGEPLRLTPSVTWGDRFLVPADAEVIVEGEIPPGQRDVCDPFGEVARLYQAQCLRPVFEVKAITFRRGAIVQDIFSGFRDSFPLGALVKEASLEDAVRPRFPNLRAIHVPDSSCGVSAAYVSVRDVQPGQVDEIGRLAFETIPILKLVVVVDDDIDVFDEPQVLWAVYTYPDLERGMTVHRPDTTARWWPQAGFGASNWSGRLVVDATRPTDFAFGLRSEVPREAIERVRLADYLPGAARIGVG
jgi:2,5-furandicarboxylate decarboxylase 1